MSKFDGEFDRLLSDIIHSKILVEPTPHVRCVIARELGSRSATTFEKACDERRVSIVVAVNESMRSFGVCTGIPVPSPEYFASRNLRRELAIRSGQTAEALKLRNGFSFIGFESELPWHVAVSVPISETVIQTFAGIAKPRTRGNSVQRNMNTAASLTSVAAFEQYQRQIAREKLPKKKRDLRLIAALNGEQFDSTVFAELADNQEANADAGVLMLQNLARPPSKRVADLLATTTMPPLRHHKNVGRSVPHCFVHYDDIIVVMQHAVSVKGRRSDVETPYFFSRWWGSTVSAVRSDNVDKHIGFVLSREPVKFDGSLTDFLACFEGAGSCSIDVISSEGPGFRHSMYFESR